MKRKYFLILTIFVLSLSVITPINVGAKTKINQKSITLTVGQKTKLKIKGTKKKVKWKSKNKSIATVNQKGKVTAKATGKTKIIATVGKKKYKCKVMVKNKLGSRENPINLSSGHVFEYENKKMRLTLLEVLDGGAANQIAKEDSFNPEPDGTNRWVLYHYKLDYLSGDEHLYAWTIIAGYHLYDSKSTKNLDAYCERMYIPDDMIDVFDVELYPGGSADMWMGILLDNNIPYTTLGLRWYDDFEDKEIWFNNK